MLMLKLADANLTLMKSLRTGGKSAAQKFWRNVSSPDRGNEGPAELVHITTGLPTSDLQRHVTDYLVSLSGHLTTHPKTGRRRHRPHCRLRNYLGGNTVKYKEHTGPHWDGHSPETR